MRRAANRVVGGVVSLAIAGLLLLPAPARAGDDDVALRQMEAAKRTLKSAVDAAETASKGKAVAAYPKLEDGSTAILVFCEVDGKCVQVPVNIETGEAGEQTPASDSERRGDYVAKAREIAKQLGEHKLTLSKLIETAETHSRGSAVSIRPKSTAGRLEFTLRVKAGGRWQFVVVDGQTGKVKSGDDKPKRKADQAPAGKSGKGGKGGLGGKGGKGGGR